MPCCATPASGGRFARPSADVDAAAMTGVNPKSVYAGATAIAVAILGFAAVFQSLRATVAPADGPFQLIYAFEAVIIGGMGSIWGAFIGAMVLGISQSIGFRINPGLRNPCRPSGVPDRSRCPPAGPSGKGMTP